MLNGVWKIWISEVLGLGSATLESIDRKIVVTPIPTRRTWFEIFVMSNKKRTGSIKRKNFGLLGDALHEVLEDLEEYWVITKS